MKKMIEITENEALLVDAELYKLQMQLIRKKWSVDDPPSQIDVKRQKIINELRSKIEKAFKNNAVDRFLNDEL